ncbi:MAG: hypothetical protein ACK2T3_07910 [Candidatus Promineifilaceae bacterium]
MKHWLRRLLILLFVMVWFCVMAFPFLAFQLAAKDEIRLGSAEGSYLRIFMVRGDEQKGLGIEWHRSSSQRSCFEHSVRYFLWEGAESGINQDSCYCVDASGVVIESGSSCRKS